MKNLSPTWREKLPAPTTFYSALVNGKKVLGSEWVSTTCVFHEDRKPSLSINLKSGGYICHACGCKGKDIVDFYRQRCKVGFVEAITQIGKGAHA